MPETITKDTRAKEQAQAQLESIKELMDALEDAETACQDGREDAEELREQAEMAIYERPLDICVRTGWYARHETPEPAEYMILLCTGGPAVRIAGELNSYGAPETAHLQYQDWFEPWTELPIDSVDREYLIQFARKFYD